MALELDCAIEVLACFIIGLHDTNEERPAAGQTHGRRANGCRVDNRRGGGTAKGKVSPTAVPQQGRPAHEIRLVLRTAGTSAVGYRLHDLALVPTARESELVGHLGPDLLGDWGPPARDVAVQRLIADPGRPVGTALLDQRVDTCGQSAMTGI
jgi:hypothetical protein